MPVTARMLGIVALATFASPVLGADDFPLVGTYTENQVCKADSSDSGVSRVKITVDDIDLGFGLCTILSRKREGATFALHVECKGWRQPNDGRHQLHSARRQDRRFLGSGPDLQGHALQMSRLIARRFGSRSPPLLHAFFCRRRHSSPNLLLARLVDILASLSFLPLSTKLGAT